VLQLGAYELKNKIEVPYRVVIDEAVELAKSFGGIDGHKYVNGLLRKVVPGNRGGLFCYISTLTVRYRLACSVGWLMFMPSW
jgi:hypothetical protein